MTLAQWATEYSEQVYRSELGTYVIPSPANVKDGHCIPSLYHLDDYKVSSVSGPVRWLVRVEQGK